MRFQDLSNISNFDRRLKCFMFQTKFADSLSEIEHRLNNINHVCEQLTSSPAVRQIFSIILSCGNYMNGGNRQRGQVTSSVWERKTRVEENNKATFRVQADGFVIDILPKIKDVKSRDNSMNLLQYVVRVWILKYDQKRGRPHEAILPVPEASDVERCSNLDFEQQLEEVSKLRGGLDSISGDRDAVMGDGTGEHLEPFGQKMAEFLEGAESSLAELTDLVSESSRKFRRAMRFYQVLNFKVIIFLILSSNTLLSFCSLRLGNREKRRRNNSSPYGSLSAVTSRTPGSGSRCG